MRFDSALLRPLYAVGNNRNAQDVSFAAMKNRGYIGNVRSISARFEDFDNWSGNLGCSTALHLARRGYTSITVLDPYAVPSPISAGNDVNKILETASFAGDDPDERYVSNKLLEAAIDGWLNDPVFKPYFHETGCIVAATTERAIAHLNSREAQTRRAAGFDSKVRRTSSPRCRLGC
jgi:glycine/D-amino acid oxidase-like deaminating enzyme